LYTILLIEIGYPYEFLDAIEEIVERFVIEVFPSVMFLSPYPYNFPVSQLFSFPAFTSQLPIKFTPN